MHVPGLRRFGLLVGVATIAFAGVLCAPAAGSDPERGYLESAITALEHNLPVEQRCEKQFTALSRDLVAKKITTRAALKARQVKVRGCFSGVKKTFAGSHAVVRKVLTLNDVSEKTAQTEIVKKDAVVAWSWLIAKEITGFYPPLEKAVALVKTARLGAPLGASSVWEMHARRPDRGDRAAARTG